MNFKQKLAYIALGCLFTALGYLLVIRLWDEAHKTAADGIAAYERGDYKKAVKIWHPLAKQGDGAAKENLRRMLTEALREMVYNDYKTAAEMLRPLAAIGFPHRVNEYTIDRPRMRFLMDKFEAAKDKAKDDAKGGAPYQRRTYDAKSLLKVTEFLIQEDRAFYSDQNKSIDTISEESKERIPSIGSDRTMRDPNAQLEELERRAADKIRAKLQRDPRDQLDESARRAAEEK
jgi:hypothetical protein